MYVIGVKTRGEEESYDSVGLQTVARASGLLRSC
jgi:hypothetical protein